jgi:hypothetical protein
MNLKTREQFTNKLGFNEIWPDNPEQFVEPFTWFECCGRL